jgi:hypothetical protein
MEKINKPYFTKYFLVEGEIKEGDRYVFDGKVRTAISIDRRYKPHGILKNEFNQTLDLPQQKVKLFLCSRDIQVGDKVWYENMEQTVLTIDNGLVHLSTGIKAKLGKPYKIIGEISPDALSYVKEGDEFDEEQVNIILGYPVVTGQEKYYDTEYECYMQRDVYKYIAKCQIKGPCGHYH